MSVLSVNVEVVLGFASENITDFFQWTSVSGICPNEQDYQANQHTTEVGVMCYPVIASCHEQLDYRISDDKELCFYGYGYREDEHAFIRENHAKCQQDAVDGTGGANGVPMVDVNGHAVLNYITALD